MARNGDIKISTLQSKTGLVETYKAISIRNSGIKHTKIMAKVLESYVADEKLRSLLQKPLKKGYSKPGKFITCPVGEKVKKEIYDLSGDNPTSAFVVHILLRYLEINKLDPNNVPVNDTEISLEYKCF